MWRLLPLALIQSMLLALGQVTLKISLQQLGAFAWTRHFFARASLICGLRPVAFASACHRCFGCISLNITP